MRLFAAVPLNFNAENKINFSFIGGPRFNSFLRRRTNIPERVDRLLGGKTN
jgi:hypothetical protein